MTKKLLLVSLLIAKTMWAIGPTVECRFAALNADGDSALDEVVAYTLNPTSGITGDFEPYSFEIAVHQNALTVGIYLDGEPLVGTQIPVINVANLPLGASVFGVNTIFHDLIAEFVSLRYECRKVMW